MVEMIKDDVPILNTNPDIPGLAPRPSAPVPEAPTASDLPNIPLCANCAPLHRTVTLCFERISAAESRINAAILLGKEAIERSSARVGAYDVLQRVLVSHGMPFQDSDRLPKEYRKNYPRHASHDGIIKGIELRAARAAYAASAEIDSQPRRVLSPGPNSNSNDECEDHSGSEQQSESEESIPPQFQPRDSSEGSVDDQSDDAESEGDEYAGPDGDDYAESEGDDNWELDAEEGPESDDVDIE